MNTLPLEALEDLDADDLLLWVVQHTRAKTDAALEFEIPMRVDGRPEVLCFTVQRRLQH